MANANNGSRQTIDNLIISRLDDIGRQIGEIRNDTKEDFKMLHGSIDSNREDYKEVQKKVIELQQNCFCTTNEIQAKLGKIEKNTNGKNNNKGVATSVKKIVKWFGGWI